MLLERSAYCWMCVVCFSHVSTGMCVCVKECRPTFMALIAKASHVSEVRRHCRWQSSEVRFVLYE